MFFNPCYESSLHHDDPVPDRKVHKDDTNLFVEFMDHPFNVQTLNPKSNSINTFIITGKASVGWHVLEVGDHFFWVLINHFSSPHICWLACWQSLHAQICQTHKICMQSR
jgi:hypothetical protein